LFLRRGSGGEEVLAHEEEEEEEAEEEEGKQKRIRVTSSLTCASSVLVNMVGFMFARLLGAFCSLSSIL
jgi:hypothetical protein